MFFIFDLMSNNSNNDSLTDLNLNYCQYFPQCGGCDIINIDSSHYQEIKKNYLKELLSKHKIPEKELQKINWVWLKSSSRRRIKLQISKHNQLGFFTKKSKNLVEITACKVANPNINRSINIIADFINHQAQNMWMSISITEFDNILDLIFYTSKSLSFQQNEQLKALAIRNSWNISISIMNKNCGIIEPIIINQQPQIFYNYHEKFDIKLSSNVFLQATKQGIETIISIIRTYIQQEFYKKNLKIKVVDLYSGFAGYSFGIIDLIDYATAFEGDENMSKIANKNANENQLKIKSFSRDLFNSPLLSNELNQFDLAIVNPPRNGATPQIKEIAKSKINHLIYVSCNPASWANDSQNLVSQGFKVEEINAIDQFYGTNNFELVVIFSRLY